MWCPLGIKVVYDDYGGAHSTPVAAAIHLGILPADRVPPTQDILKLPMFDRAGPTNHGCLVFMGRDSEGNDVYILGRGPSGITVERAVASGVALTGGDIGALHFFDTLPCVNLWMRIGGFLSRALGWTGLGRPIVLYGTRKAYPQLVRFVTRVKDTLATDPIPPTMIASDGGDLGVVAGQAVKRGVLPGIQDGPMLSQEESSGKEE